MLNKLQCILYFGYQKVPNYTFEKNMVHCQNTPTYLELPKKTFILPN